MSCVGAIYMIPINGILSSCQTNIQQRTIYFTELGVSALFSDLQSIAWVVLLVRILLSSFFAASIWAQNTGSVCGIANTATATIWPHLGNLRYFLFFNNRRNEMVSVFKKYFIVKFRRKIADAERLKFGFSRQDQIGKIRTV